MTPRLFLYPHHELRRVLAPRSVAVLGATPRPGSFGERTVYHLLGLAGGVYPVNAKYQEVAGKRCYASLKDLPEVPDCVFIVTGRESVEGLLLEAADAGVGGAVIYAAGFAETGKPERVAEQRRLTAIARERHIRIVGPNCIGIFNHGIGLNGTFAQDIDLPKPRAHGTIGLVSQSGALGVGMTQAVRSGTSYSHVYTAGNSCDVDAADMVGYLADDPACQAIACLFEGMAHPQRMVAAAELARARGKPLVIFKMASGEQGAQAALSHTGSLAGAHAAYRAAFERAGAVMVDDFEALVEAANFFAKVGAPKARGVAVASTSGGAGIMAADKAEKYGVALSQPHPATTEVLLQHIPEFGSARNPCDITAQVMTNPGSLAAVGNALLQDDQFGALVYPSPFAASYAAQRMPDFEAMARAQGKPVCVVWLALWQEGTGLREAMEQPSTPVFHSMDRCFATLAAWHRRDDLLQRGERRLVRVADAAAKQHAAGLIHQAAHRALTEREAKQVLAAYGVPVVGEQLVSTADAAVAGADRLGYPVVMKVESPDLPHKTEAGVIRLNLKNEADVRAGFDAVMANAHKVQPPPRINGVLVQPMVPAGTEIMVGGRVDPQFGPLIVVGLGGVLVELMKDTAVDLAPVNHTEALAMLGKLKGQAALNGFRGSAPVNREKLADLIVRLSEFMADQASCVAELDVNPLICAGDRIVAVDALIVKRDEGAATSDVH